MQRLVGAGDWNGWMICDKVSHPLHDMERFESTQVLAWAPLKTSDERNDDTYTCPSGDMWKSPCSSKGKSCMDIIVQPLTQFFETQLLRNEEEANAGDGEPAGTLSRSNVCLKQT